MRHFLSRKLVPEAIAVSCLPHRLEPSRPRFASVRGSRTSNRFASLCGSAVAAQTLPTITTTADAKLDPTLLADREPVRRRRQEAPCRRFLDMEPEPW